MLAVFIIWLVICYLSYMLANSIKEDAFKDSGQAAMMLLFTAISFLVGSLFGLSWGLKQYFLPGH